MLRFLIFTLTTLVATSTFASTDLQVFTFSENAYLVEPGTTATFFAGVRNNGPDIARNVVMTVPLPPGSKLQSIEPYDGWSCSGNDSEVICKLGDVPLSKIGDLSTRMRFTAVLSSDPEGMVSYALATVTSDTPDDLEVNNRASIQTIIWRMLIVNSTADSGAGTLRAAMDRANSRCTDNVPCKIKFDLPQPSTIEPLSPLPPLTTNYLRMEGNRQRSGDRVIELSGSRLRTGNGLELRSDGTPHQPFYFDIAGLAINGFPDFGVALIGTGYSSADLGGLFVGTDVTGTIARPNGRGFGLFAAGSNVNIRDDVISGNVHSGVFAWTSGGTWMNSCLVGVGTDESPLGNGNSGVFQFRGALDVSSCVIANNGQFGVSLEREVNRGSISNTRIFSNGIVGIDWGLDGPSPDTTTITDAVYDSGKNETVISGTLDSVNLGPGVWPLRYVELFANTSRNIQGHAEGERMVAGVVPSGQAFTARAKGDLRGQIITATLSVGLYLDSGPTLTTEFSEGFVAH